MNAVQQSLEDNKEQILAALPKQFHADFISSIAKAAPRPVLTDEEVVQAIKDELARNPNVDEAAAADALKDIQPPKRYVAPSPEELKAEMAAALEAAKAMGPHPESAG